MKSGAPMAGTPELAFMNYAIGQLARRYRLPLRSSGMLCGAKTVDAQAAYESVQTMWPVFLAGAVIATVPALVVFAVAQRRYLRETGWF